MNDQQVVASLLAFYKQQGMDLSYVLDDPIFVKLPLAARVAAIKKHAQEIVDGTSPGFNKIDRNAILTHAAKSIIAGGFTGASLGAAWGSTVPGFKPKNTAVIGALAGATAGLANSALGRYHDLSARQAVRGQLQAAAADPSDVNAIGALSVQGIHNRQGAARNEILQTLRDATSHASSKEGIAPLIGYYEQELAKAHAAKTTP
jgi:uncharacterized membrane protein